MGTTWTISQQPTSSNLYLYPDASVSTNMTSSGTDISEEAIDDIWSSPDEDTTYIYTTSTTSSTGFDVYGLPDHTTETGVINYVKLIGRSRVTATDNSVGTYRLFVEYSGSTSYGNNESPLTTSYSNYSFVTASTTTNETLTWDSIDDMNIGLSCSAAGTPGTAQTTLWFDGAAGYCDIEAATGGAPCTYTLLTDSNDGTYVNTAGATADQYAYYPCDDLTGDILSITQVEFFYRVQGTTTWQTGCVLYTNGEKHIFDYETLTGSWVWQSFATATDPATGVAWTQAGVNALQWGIQFHQLSDNGTCYCSQAYAVVTYSIGIEMRTTQLYAVVNYTPTADTVTLNQPETLNVSHSRNVGRTTFSSGDYEVDDYGRSGKTLSVSGQETTDADDDMQALKDIVHYASAVTVAGLDDSNLNGDYHIMDFSFSAEAGMTQNRYRWNLVLEED